MSEYMSNPFWGQAVVNLYPNVKKVTQFGAFSISGGEETEVNIDPDAVETEVKKLQAEHDSKKYQRDRADAYPDLPEQFDLLWHAIDDGKFNVKSKDTDFYKKLKAVKDANPKPE